jgi:hypothetical protein
MISLTQKFHDLAGVEVPNPNKTDEALTLGNACVMALCGQYADETKIEGVEKFERWVLASKIMDAAKDGQALQFESKIITKLKDLVAKAFPTLITGQAWLMLDPALNSDTSETKVVAMSKKK